MASGAEIAAYLALKAAESFAKKVGENVADEITGWLFGPDDDMSSTDQSLLRIQEQLGIIDAKLDNVIEITSETLLLVRQFPSVLSGVLDEQERDTAYRNLESDYTVFRNLANWDGLIGGEALQLSFRSWRTVVSLEHRVEEMIRLLRYAEFLRLISKGDLTGVLISDIRDKLQILIDQLDYEKQDLIAERYNEAFYLGSEGVIFDVRHLYKEPWIEWKLGKPRTHRVHVDYCTHVGYHDPDRCFRFEERPDIRYNNKIKEAKNRMPTIQEDITKSFKKMQTLQVVIETMSRYVSYLERSDIASIGVIGGISAKVKNQTDIEGAILTSTVAR